MPLLATGAIMTIRTRAQPLIACARATRDIGRMTPTLDLSLHDGAASTSTVS
jgi:hypothetical protein